MPVAIADKGLLRTWWKIFLTYSCLTLKPQVYFIFAIFQLHSFILYCDGFHISSVITQLLKRGGCVIKYQWSLSVASPINFFWCWVTCGGQPNPNPLPQTTYSNPTSQLMSLLCEDELAAARGCPRCLPNILSILTFSLTPSFSRTLLVIWVLKAGQDGNTCTSVQERGNSWT